MLSDYVSVLWNMEVFASGNCTDVSTNWHVQANFVFWPVFYFSRLSSEGENRDILCFLGVVSLN